MECPTYILWSLFDQLEYFRIKTAAMVWMDLFGFGICIDFVQVCFSLFFLFSTNSLGHIDMRSWLKITFDIL